MLPTGRLVPRWLFRLPVRYGRPPTLKRAGVRTLAAPAELSARLTQARDAFLGLLLREVELRALKPHHLIGHALPGYGPTLLDTWQAVVGGLVLLGA